MKVLILLFIITFNLDLYGASCTQLQQDLATIQYQLETKQLNPCTAENRFYCKNPNDPDSGKTVYQAKLEYNQALAELTLHEGLIALGTSIEDNHNALIDISAQELNQAKSHIDEFTRAFNRGKVLQKSLTLEGDKSLWDDYSGQDIQSMQEYLNTICVNPKAYKEFCKELAKTQKSSNSEQWKEVVETLQGFSESDRRVLRTDRDTQYSRYNDYLKVNVNGTLVELTALEENGSYKKTNELKALIEAYEKQKTPENLKAVIKKSQEIDEIDINYHGESTARKEFQAFAEKDLKKQATKIHSASGLFLNINKTKDNFEKIDKTLDTELQMRKVTLDKEIEKFGISDCSGDKLKCIEVKCKPDKSSGNCTQDASNRELMAKGLDTLYKKVKAYNDSKRVSDAVKNINIECFQSEKRKKRSELNTCVKDTYDKLQIPLDIQKQKQKLLEKKKVLDYLTNGSPIKDLEVYKALTVNALHANKCLSKKEEMQSLQFSCIKDLGVSTSKGVLELGEVAQKVISDYNIELYNKFLKTKDGYGEEYQRSRAIFLKSCETDSTLSNLCAHLKEENRLENTKVRVTPLSARAFDNLRQQKGQVRDEGEEYGPWSYLGIGVAHLAVSGTMAWMQMDMQQTQFDIEMDMFRQQSAQNEQFNKRQREFLENYQPFYSPYQNWGFNYWNPYPTSLQNFNFGNQSLFFNSSSLNFSQFNFPPSSFSSGVSLSPPGVRFSN